MSAEAGGVVSNFKVDDVLTLLQAMQWRIGWRPVCTHLVGVNGPDNLTPVPCGNTTTHVRLVQLRQSRRSDYTPPPRWIGVCPEHTDVKWLY